jgi:hypothetical protein
MANPVDPLAKKFYVLSASGEVGPCHLDDLREHLAQGTITAGDQVRSGFGKNLGTVLEILGGRVLSSGSRIRGVGNLDGPSGGHPQTRRYSSGPRPLGAQRNGSRHAARSSGKHRAAPEERRAERNLAWLIAGVALVAMLVGVVLVLVTRSS